MIDIYYELTEKINTNLSKNGIVGIYATIYDPDNKELAQFFVSDEPHRSFQQKIKRSGLYRVCLTGSDALFRYAPNAKYEMSIIIESIFPHAVGQESLPG